MENQMWLMANVQMDEFQLDEFQLDEFQG